MGMTGDDDVKTCRDRIEVEGTKVMEHVEKSLLQLDDLRRRKPFGPGAAIHVAAYGKHRAELLQSLDHVEGADVACMHDEIHPPQSCKGLPAHQSVGVGMTHNDLQCASRLSLPMVVITIFVSSCTAAVDVERLADDVAVLSQHACQHGRSPSGTFVV